MILTGFFVGMNVYVHASLFTPSHPIQAMIQIPRESLDLSDLDVRDEFNRVIQSTEKRKSLERLFVKSLNELLLNNLTPVQREKMNRLYKFISKANFWLEQSTKFITRSIAIWFQEKKKELSRLVLNAANVYKSNEIEIHKSLSWQYTYSDLIPSILASSRLLL